MHSNPRSSVILAALVTFALAGLAGCSASVSTGKTLDTGKAQAEIATGLKQQTDTKVKVVCPKDVKVKKAGTFTCKVTTADGRTGSVKVTQKDKNGNISWALQ